MLMCLNAYICTNFRTSSLGYNIVTKNNINVILVMSKCHNFVPFKAKKKNYFKCIVLIINYKVQRPILMFNKKKTINKNYYKYFMYS